LPDATGLELLAAELREQDSEMVLDTDFHRDRATLIVSSQKIREVLQSLSQHGYRALSSLHGVDYYPEEPRLGVLYELLDMERVDRLSVKLRVASDEPSVPSVVELYPTANFQEREVYDMFGVVFDGHPDLRRILMPEDYEGHPQRRDFPVGGEPVLFTYNEEQSYGKWQ
jgi:NADH-quinone oxidoreductase subunit C